ncbi:MAG: Autotransporter-associated beta strand repeat protein [Pedosphaera sp.]|nr:Autotransporter-associated beta strand repeat protein [Pedosphaera sp.]
MKKILSRVVRHLILALACLAALLNSISAKASSHTWAGVGLTGYWSLPANWAGNNPPVAGEAAPVTITFPSGASRLINTNNVGGLVLDQLNFTGSGYTIHGFGVGTNIILRGSAGTAVLNAASAANTMAGSMYLTLSNNVNFTINTNGSLVLASVVQGTGGLSKLGLGTLTLFANFADTYTGATYVTTGILKLYCGTSGSPQVAVPGYLQIGGNISSSATVQLLANSQLSPTAALQIDYHGLLDLNNASATCGPLTFNSGVVQTGSGTLTLGGDVTVGANQEADIYGKLSLGGTTRQFNTADNSDVYLSASLSDGGSSSGITKTGGGSLRALGTNTFSGPIVINDGGFLAFHQFSFGTGAGGVNVNSNGILYLVEDFMVVSNVTATLDGHGSTTGGRISSMAGPAYWVGPIVLASDSTFENYWPAQSWFVVNGSISGPGGVRLIGGDMMYFGGDTDNTFTGTLTISSVNTNGLGLEKTSGATSISGPIVIGDPNGAANSAYLYLDLPNQIANSAPITINQSGVFDLSGYNETVGALTFHDGNVKGSGQLTLTGNVTNYGGLYGNANIDCPVSLGGQTRLFNALGGDITLNGPVTDGGAPAGITKYGNGYLDLVNSNSYSGLTLVNEGTLGVYHSHALGSTVAGTTIAGGYGIYFPGNVSVVGESLTINSDVTWYFQGTNFWTGPIALAAVVDCFGPVATSWLTLGGAITGAGGLTASGSCTLRLTGTNSNTFTGPLVAASHVVELAKTNALAVSGPLQVSSDCTVRYRNANQILDTSSVKVNYGGVLDLNSFNDNVGDFSGSGTVNLGSALLTVGGGNPTNTFSGVITGNALCELDKLGGNTLILSGINTYSGNTFVKGGTLLANGSQPTSDVYISPGATLGGNGTVGNLYDLGGTISPGNSPGKLNCGYLTLNSGSTFVAELKGTGVGTSYDQLNVTGAITINSGVALNLTKTFAGAISNQFVIVNNDLADAVSGTFNGLANGATFTANGTAFRINYNGGSGNDIVLTQLGLPPGPQISGVGKSGGSLQISGTALTNMQYQVQASTNLTTTNWINLGTVTADGAGAFQFTDSQAANFAQRFYRLLLP